MLEQNDIEGGAALRLFKRVHLNGGFRMLDYAVSGDSSNVRAQHAGPFVGLRLRF